MGTVDRYSGVARCPGCGEVHFVSGQTQLFDPAGSSRSYRAGKQQDKALNPEILTTALWDGRWWRLRPARAGATHVDVLHWIEDVFRCGCERVLAPVLHVAVGANSVCIEEIRLVDVERTGFEQAIDLVGQWAPSEELARLPQRPLEDRVAWLRGRMQTIYEPRPTPPGWTLIVGPTQCEACGDVRERTITTTFTQPHSPQMSLLGAKFDPRTLYLGDRVRVGPAWQPNADGLYTVRRPIADTMTVLSRRQDFGCACGAGHAAFVQRFARRGDELELFELGLRAVYAEGDLSDVDVVEGRFSQDAPASELVWGYRQWK